MPVSPGHRGLTVVGRQQQAEGGWGRRGCCARCHRWCPEAPGWDRWPSAGPWRAWEPPGPARHCLLSLCPTPAPSAQSAERWGGVWGRVGRAMAGAGGRRRRPGRRQAHAGLSVGPGDCIDQRSTRCQRVRAAPASPTACCPHEGSLQGQGGVATVGAAVTSRCGRSAAANCAWGLRLLGLQKERRLRGAAGGVAVVAGSSRRSRGGRPASREGDLDCGRLDFGVAKGLTRRCMAVLTGPEP